jgi:hypothetical protein
MLSVEPKARLSKPTWAILAHRTQTARVLCRLRSQHTVTAAGFEVTTSFKERTALQNKDFVF